MRECVCVLFVFVVVFVVFSNNNISKADITVNKKYISLVVIHHIYISRVWQVHLPQLSVWPLEKKNIVNTNWILLLLVIFSRLHGYYF